MQKSSGAATAPIRPSPRSRKRAFPAFSQARNTAVRPGVCHTTKKGSLIWHAMRKWPGHVMLSGSEESEEGHAVRLVRPDASLPLSMTRQRVFFIACHVHDTFLWRAALHGDCIVDGEHDGENNQADC